MHAGTYRSIYSDKSVFEPEGVEMNVLEVCLPKIALYLESLIEVDRRSSGSLNWRLH
jgi:hypothetical protein